MTPEIADLLWKDASEILFISKDEFLRGLEGWEVEPVEFEGKPAFAVLTKGPEFHFQSFGTGQPISMKMIRERLQKIIDAHGYALTRTPKIDVRQHVFNLAFGFTLVGQDEYDRHYRIETLRGRSH